MTYYATPSDLLERFDAAEIAQRCDRGIPRLVNGDLLMAVAKSADLSAYTDDESARAHEALALVQRALQDASDTINTYLSGRYSMPLATVPSVLSRVASELARYYLYDDQVTDAIKTRYDANIKWLEGVSKGTVALGVESASGAQPVSNAGAELVSSGSVWKRPVAGGFL